MAPKLLIHAPMFLKQLRKQFLLILTSLFVLMIVKISSADTITWTNTAGGSWSDGINWDLHRVPASDDDVLITLDGTYAITVANAVQAEARNVTIGAINGTQSLVLTNSTDFLVQQNLTVQTNGVCLVGHQINFGQMFVSGKLFWLSGTLGGPLTVQTNGNLTITGGTSKGMQSAITNQGTITWAEPSLFTGGSSVLVNQGLFILQTNLVLGGGANFINSGTILEPSGTTNSLQNVGGNFANGGTMLIQTNASLTLMAMWPYVLNLTDGTVISGPGLLRLDNTSTSSVLNADGTITVDGTFELFNGNLRGNQTWTGSGNFNWIGGTMAGAGITTIGTNFHLNILVPNTKSLDGHTLVNRGTVNWIDGFVGLLNTQSAFINDGLLVCGHFGGFGGSSLPNDSLFQNNGTLLCPADQQAFFLCNCNFTNRGTVTVQSNSVLEFSSSYSDALNFADGTLLNGPGTTQIKDIDLTASGTITVDGTFELAALQFVGGTLKGTQTWTGTGNFNWIGGTMAGAGITTIGTNFNLNISVPNSKSLDGHTLVNHGTVNWIEGVVDTRDAQSTFINDSLLICPSSGGFVASTLNYNSLFQNNGTLLCPADRQQSFFLCNWHFTNSGTVTVQSNSVLEFSSSYSDALNFADGTLLNGPGKTQIKDIDLTASGTITVDGTFELAALQFVGGTLKGTQTWTGTGNFNWTGGTMGQAGITTVGTNFHFNILGTQQKFIDGHTLVNHGTVNWIEDVVYTLDTKSTFINDSLLICPPYGGFAVYASDNSSVFQNNGTLLCPADRQLSFFLCNWNFTNSGTLTVQSNSVLEFSRGNYGSVNFADGTLLNGPGKTQIEDAELIASGTITVDGTFELAAQSYANGTLKGTQTWAGSGNFNWSGGGMAQAGITTVGTNFHFNILGTQQKFIDGHTLVNHGTVNWTEGVIFSQNGPGAFINDSLLICPPYGGFAVSSSDNSSVFKNNGTLLCPANRQLSFFLCNWNFTNSGTLTVQSNSVLEFTRGSYGSLNFADGTLLNGPGKTQIEDTDLTASGTITVDGTFELAGHSFASGTLKGTQTWAGSGKFNWTGGTITAPGITTLSDNFHLNIQGTDQKNLNNHTLYNRGNITFSSVLFGSTNAIINNAGLFNLDNFCSFASADGTAGFNNLSGGTIGTPGTNVPPSQIYCTMNWAFANAGVLALNSGTFNITPVYSPAASSTHHFTLNSYSPGSSSGLLNLGAFTPAGTLEIALGNGLVVTNGSTFQFITYTSHTGTFTSQALPSLPASLSWELDYQPTALILKAISAPLELKSAQKLADGSFQITAAGSTGSAYVIETSTNLVNWAALQTNNAANGTVEFLDSSATNFSKRFYRMRMGN
ncbi:MAG: hypothetical protein JWQ71_3545 [Pedosphaera sp.]|nr:hypothetical protein [Pedosphaera sp.]